METKPPLTKTLVLEYMQRAVDEVGATYKISEVCRYFDLETGRPVCLIGYLLHYHGYKQVDIGSDIYSSASMNNKTCPNLTLPATRIARDIMRFAQNQQDAGTAWGEVLTNTKQYALNEGYSEDE